MKDLKCQKCGQKFNLINRKRICYNCGNSVCRKCSTKCSFVAEKVIKLKFGTEILCKDCSSANEAKLQDENLKTIIAAYNAGCNDGHYAGFNLGSMPGAARGIR